ncbi:cyclic nucleotide-gated cation channel alpha-3 [Trichonephila clavata]|uniref:Cyclic nucleotide-gated cation channel alpha-3 n=1 Tax=Trichonephila clavata TaxID=2740835 RepID=A0A8X6GBY2_TRICU|nr:cyclic nucleotide-gated cation channel alpha-3 [Trichonephila clavata]
MVEGSPRRVSVSAHDANIKIPLDLTEEEEKNNLRYRQHESIHKTESGSDSPSGSRWKKLRTTVQLGNAVTHHRKPPLKREDSFLKRFSTRPPNVILSDKDPIKANNWFYRLARASVLNPDESLLFWWLWLVTFCGLYNSWTLIAREAFPELQEAHVVLWNVLDWCSDVVYFLDIAVQFRTGYLEQGIMVRDGAQLAKHYVTSRDFFLDVAALAPLSFLQGMVGDSPLLRFPRFLKARRIYKFYYAVESRTAYPNLWRVANLIHVLLLLAHWFGCFYYMLSELEGFKGNWAYKNPENPEHSPLVRKYLGSVYWSTLTLTTIGDLATPATNLQYLFTIISYLIGVFIFATIVGKFIYIFFVIWKV